MILRVEGLVCVRVKKPDVQSCPYPTRELLHNFVNELHYSQLHRTDKHMRGRAGVKDVIQSDNSVRFECK